MTSPLRSALAALLLFTGAVALAQPAERPIPEAEREALLALPWEQFDQTPKSGWRIFVNAERSDYLTAAAVIEAYLARHPDLPARQRALCRYHGAMMHVYRAVRSGGDARLALPGLRAALLDDQAKGAPSDWNHMVRATIAFLSDDRAALLDVQAQVAALPKGAAKWPDYPAELLANLGKPYGSWVPGFDKKPQ